MGSFHSIRHRHALLTCLSRRYHAEYVGERAAASKKGEPFFAYVPLAAPHTPIVPTNEWKGKSGLGNYGDFVMQTDAVVGQVMQALQDAPEARAARGKRLEDPILVVSRSLALLGSHHPDALQIARYRVGQIPTLGCR